MPRSVVLRPTVRCPACRMPHRWCICAGFRTAACRPRVDVLMDRLEQYRPTSTGMLIQRTLPASHQHLFQRQVRPDPAAIRDPQREIWILHTRGESLPTDVAPDRIQVLLLDGSWQAVGVMLPHLEGWGRRIRLPDTGPSRYWLRSANADGRLSTLEALIALLRALGDREPAATLDLQFELHVFAGLLARGKRAEGERFLADSPVRQAFPELVARLLGPSTGAPAPA